MYSNENIFRELGQQLWEDSEAGERGERNSLFGLGNDPGGQRRVVS